MQIRINKGLVNETGIADTICVLIVSAIPGLNLLK